MNEEKTEVLFCNPKKLKQDIGVHFITINHEKICFSEKAKNLGVYFDCNLSMEHQINHLCKSLFYELRKIGQLSTFLNESSLKTLVSSFIFSRIDYCNSLLVNLPNVVLQKLQRLQNQAARIVLRRKKRDHITPMLLTLHWLPVNARIIYKISVLCYKCINGTAPSYLVDLVNVYNPSRSLRSSDQLLLSVPRKGSKKLADRSFSHSAPPLWNSLPHLLRNTPTEVTFKTNLKTYLMRCFIDNDQ